MEEGRLPKIIYDEMKVHNEPWIAEVREIFQTINCETVFANDCRIINIKEFLDHAKQTLMSHHVASWQATLERKPKLELYRNIKNTLELENYCKVNLTRGQRSVLAKLRLGILPINIELERYNGTPREERICQICDSGEIEDEKHFLFVCPVYAESRRVLLNNATLHARNFDEMNSNEKISILTTHTNLIRKTSRYLLQAISTRNDKLRLPSRV